MESHINKHFIFVGKQFRGRGRYKRNSVHCILWGNLKYSAVRRATLERAIKISNSDVREPVEKYSPISNHDEKYQLMLLLAQYMGEKEPQDAELYIG